MKRDSDIEQTIPGNDISLRKKSVHVHLVQYRAKIVGGHIFQIGTEELTFLCDEIINIYDQLCSQTVEIQYYTGQPGLQYRDLKIDHSHLREVFCFTLCS